jgi:DNA-binding MarR family transcriptional regulator
MATHVEATGELSAEELNAWRGLLRAHAALVKALDAQLEERHGMPLSSYEFLIVLNAAPERRLRMSDLAQTVLLSRSGVTRLVDRLEREGLLERVTCSSDGRGCFAALTEKGVRTLAEVRPTHLAGVRERFLSHFTPDELAVMADFWERLAPRT